MYCPFCGTDNATDQKYCRNCGASLPTTVTKSPTKAHNAVPTQRPSAPFVPPAPPNLPKQRSKVLEPVSETPPSAPALEEDPGATNLSYKLPGFGAKPSAAANDIIDNFYETQAMGNMLNVPIPVPNKPIPMAGLSTVEMSSLNSSEEDLKSTNVAVPVARLDGKFDFPEKSEEYFPTVLTQPKPPESAEEQLKLLKELTEGSESWKVPPPAPPPPPAVVDQTLSMGAIKPSDISKNDKKAMSKTSSSTLEKALSATPSSAGTPPSFLETLTSASSFSESQNDPLSNNVAKNPPKIEPPSLGSIPQTLTIKAAPKGKGEETFSYPNLENMGQDPMSETVQLQPAPPEEKDIASALSSWSPEVTNVWGTPAPSIPLSSDAKTETLINKSIASPPSPQEKAKSKKDAFKTISVGPRAPKCGQEKDTPSTLLIQPLGALVDNEEFPSPSADFKMPPQENLLANTAPMGLTVPQTPEVPSTTAPVVAKDPIPPPSIPTPIQPQPNLTPVPPTTNKTSLKIPILITIILVLVFSIVFIAWKLVQNIYNSSNPIVTTTPKTTPSPIASVSPTPQVTSTPEPISDVPENMVLIPEGEYKIGSDASGPRGDLFATPQHPITVQAFYIDIYEVTNDEYSKFTKATGHTTPNDWQNGQYPGKPQDPVSNVSWEDAQAYAKWADKRLPTEEEWEIAASGQEHFFYPWGNNSDTTRANSKEFGAKSVRTVGSVKTSKSPFGVYDMSGNLWEWTSSSAKLYPNSKYEKPVNSQEKIFRGGSYEDELEYCSTTYRNSGDTKLTSNVLGFRCAKDIKKGNK